MRIVIALLLVLVTSLPGHALVPTFGGVQCKSNCVGERAGYEWARKNNITNELDCDEGMVAGFMVGCMMYRGNKTLDSKKDDQGNLIPDVR
ncbi:hypothetical protein [Xanthobacter versatilis]|uniref:hypothetical protein n=1 Tax=Xanthobacter autotrophicus (strain ATCC BAA-1158 / Py2) TaxID=78245 RepID=UPI00372BBA5E